MRKNNVTSFIAKKAQSPKATLTLQGKDQDCGIRLLAPANKYISINSEDRAK